MQTQGQDDDDDGWFWFRFYGAPKTAVYAFAFWTTKPIRFDDEKVKGSFNEFYTNMLVRTIIVIPEVFFIELN